MLYLEQNTAFLNHWTHLVTDSSYFSWSGASPLFHWWVEQVIMIKDSFMIFQALAAL